MTATSVRQFIALHFAVNREVLGLLTEKWTLSAKLVDTADVSQRCFCVELMVDAALLHAIRDMIARMILCQFIDKAVLGIGLGTCLVNAIMAYIGFSHAFGSPFFPWIGALEIWASVGATLLMTGIFRLWHDDWKWRVLRVQDLF